MDLINLILQYIPVDFLFIVLGLVTVGEMLKKYTTLPNQLLTTVLPILGAILTGVIYATGALTFEAAEFIKQICVGLFLGWSATGGFEWMKNTFLTKFTNEKIIIQKEKDEEVTEIITEPKENE